MYFGLKQCTLRFQNEKAYSGNYVRDGGFNSSETEGLFSKVTRERVSSNRGRRSGDGRIGLALGKKEKGVWPSTVAPALALHGCRRGARWSARFGGYNPRFEELRTPGSSGGEGEPAKANTVAGGECRDDGRHGQRPKAHGRT